MHTVLFIDRICIYITNHLGYIFSDFFSNNILTFSNVKTNSFKGSELKNGLNHPKDARFKYRVNNCFLLSTQVNVLKLIMVQFVLKKKKKVFFVLHLTRDQIV